jgi:hypothetical protein
LLFILLLLCRYGESGLGKIPGNQSLVFRVTLVGQEKKKLGLRAAK